MNKEPSTDSQFMTRQEIEELMESEKLERQRSGRFEFMEIPEILSDISGDDFHYIHIQLQKAFDKGDIIFFREGGSPVDPADYNMWPAYGEYTTPDEINKWLNKWGAAYSFSEETPTKHEEHRRKGQLQEEAILKWLIRNRYNPQALPSYDRLSKTNPGVKSRVTKELIKERNDLFSSISTINATWKRLRKQERIGE